MGIQAGTFYDYLAAVPALCREGRWEDQSWHNDAAARAVWPLCACEQVPCGTRRDRMMTACEGHERLVLWVAEVEPVQREYPDAGRFTLVRIAAGMDDGDGLVLYSGDDEATIRLLVAKCVAGEAVAPAVA